MSWDKEDLLSKAGLFLDRGFEAERDGPVFPFWAALALELYGRAVLANVSPALLADPNQGESVLYAFGLAKSGKSVQAKTVFERCRVIVPELSKDDYEFALFLLDRRNAEVHSGEPAFEDLPSNWIARYLRLLRLLLESVGMELKDVLPPAEVEWLEEVGQTDEEAVRGAVKKRINVCREHFEMRPEEERNRLHSDAALRKLVDEAKALECPACAGAASLRGELKVTRDPVLRDDVLHIEHVYLPSSFVCTSCGLEMSSYAELAAAGYGAAFTVTNEEDPFDYYGEMYAEQMAYEDYGNE